MAGVRDQQFLHAGGGFPQAECLSVYVATDDVIAFERGSPCAVAPSTVCLVFNNLECTWNKMWTVGKEPKEVNRSPGVTALGLDLVDGKFILPKCSRLCDVVSALIFVLVQRAVRPADCGHFFGVLQWMLLANRPMPACSGTICGFIDPDASETTRMPNAPPWGLAPVACFLLGLVVDLQSE